jgi:Mn2+/Fe2+ NRAMP family transporter
MTFRENALEQDAVNAAARPVAPPGARIVASRWRRNLLLFLLVFGPGLIVMEADNDAGAVTTYTQAGAQYGLHLLWVLVLLLPITYFCQEMVARLGIATGEGHAAMIYKRFGHWWGRFSLVDLELVNFLTIVTEFAGIALAADALGISVYIAVPLFAVGLVALVLTGSYRRWERITIVLCLLDLSWLAFAVAVGPNVGDVAHNSAVPNIPPGGITGSLTFLVIAIVGTTIAPWQLFFQQSCVADKRLRFADLTHARLDTFIGACFTIIVAGLMMMVGDLSFRHGLNFTDPGQMARDLGPYAGPLVRYGVPLLFINAAILGATAVSLASSWAFAEVRGVPHSLQMSWHDAPGFYGAYGFFIVVAAAIVLIPHAPLNLIILSVQVLAGIMLPVALIFLQLLLNDRELLGDRWINKRWNNTVNWVIIALLFVLSLLLATQVIFPSLFPS